MSEVNGCPFCGACEDCDHLLAHIDVTFGTCSGGHAFDRCGNFDGELEASFSELYDAGKRSGLDWGDLEHEEALAAQWEEYLDDRSVGEATYCSTSQIELALISDYTSLDVSVVSEIVDGAPGMTSEIISVYAEDPEKEFNSAVSYVPDLLDDKLREFLGDR